MNTSNHEVEIAGFTDTGLNRQHNEDSIAFDAPLGIAILADGMGGHKAGEVASKMAVDGILSQLKTLKSDKWPGSITGSQLLGTLVDTILHTNREIYESALNNASQQGMGTTLVVAVTHGNSLYLAHVGDSRLYFLDNQGLRVVTKDHSLVQDLIDKGFYTPEEAQSATISHVVTRALGAANEVEVDTGELQFESGDAVLLCSDGLTDMLSDTKIGETLANNAVSLEYKVEELVKLANQSGGKDNISVILMSCS